VREKDRHLKGFRTCPEFHTFFQAVRPSFNDIEEMWCYQLDDTH
jgi:hypothetical protein